MIVPIDEMPEQVPFMLLPNAVLLPNSVLPLYIFEYKYREMLADCLAGNRMFGIAKVNDGVSEVRSEKDVASVVGVGLIRACMANQDGTSTLVLMGLGRFRISHWDRSRPYWIGHIQPLKNLHSEATLELEQEILQRCQHLSNNIGNLLPQLKDYKIGQSDAGLLADVLGSALLDSSDDRQALLEETNVRMRLSMVLDKMQF